MFLHIKMTTEQCVFYLFLLFNIVGLVQSWPDMLFACANLGIGLTLLFIFYYQYTQYSDIQYMELLVLF